jgi:hypothetical protein
MRKHYVILLCIFFLIFSCRKWDKVDDEKIFASYTVSYDASLGLTSVKAGFIYNRNLIQLDEKNLITVNGESLLYNEKSFYYEKNFEGFLHTSLFVWQTGKKTYRNNLTIKPIYFLPELDSINITNNFLFQWGGDTLEKNEMVEIAVESPYALSYKYFYEYQEGAIDVFMSLHVLNEIGMGRKKVELSRIKEVIPGQSNKAGGLLKGVYKSLPDSITFW